MLMSHSKHNELIKAKSLHATARRCSFAMSWPLRFDVHLCGSPSCRGEVKGFQALSDVEKE